MARMLLVGIDPEAVDFSDPALPAGMDAEMICRGIVRGLDELRATGHDAEQLFIPADPARLGGLAERLTREPVDCVVVGGGVRIPPRNLVVFEAVLNIIAGAPVTPTIALVTRPDDAASAVARVLGQRAGSILSPR